MYVVYNTLPLFPTPLSPIIAILVSDKQLFFRLIPFVVMFSNLIINSFYFFLSQKHFKYLV